MALTASSILTTTPLSSPFEGVRPTPRMFVRPLSWTCATVVQTLVVPTSMPTMVRCAIALPYGLQIADCKLQIVDCRLQIMVLLSPQPMRAYSSRHYDKTACWAADRDR